MDLTHTWRPVLSDGVARVVSCLAATSSPLTGRAVARIAGLSQAGAHKVLVNLAQSGVVTSDPAGAASMYRLNRSHVLTPHLLGIIQASDEIVERIKALIAGWSVLPLHASLFGSVARAEATPASDIDLLLIRADQIGFDDPTWRLQVGDLGRSVHAWTGQFLSTLEFGRTEFAGLIRSNEPIVAEWRRDAISLTDESLSVFLRQTVA